MGKQISSARLLERLWSGAGELVDRAGMLLGPEGHVPDADAVHEIRVISKRLRAVWQLLRPALGAEVAVTPLALLVVAIAGFPGALLVILLAYAGVAFVPGVATLPLVAPL